MEDFITPEEGSKKEKTTQKEEGEEEGERTLSVERIFKAKGAPPSWREQLTFRAFVVSFLLGIMFTFIVMKLNLTVGIIPSLNMSAALLGFFFVKTWTKVLEKSKLLKQPFTRQENTVIQTCVVATSAIASSGYLFGMSERIAKQSTEANNSQNVKDPAVGWMIGFLLVVSFLGLFSLVPLRKIMIIDYKLVYPSGTATAHLINSFHTSRDAKLTKKQVQALGQFFSFSFFWGFFQWFFKAEEECGFSQFPTFGLKAYENRFYFDFSATYVGVGMICPYLVNVSLLVGAVLSWGIMWPIIDSKKGDWYTVDPKNPNSLHGLQGYRVFIAIAVILGDGLYNLFKVSIKALSAFFPQNQNKKSSIITAVGTIGQTTDSLSYDDQRRVDVFLKDQIPTRLAVSGYLIAAAISIFTLPAIFSPLKWYHLLVAYIFAPVLAFCDAYGTGLTDFSMSHAYGKLAIFTIAAWAGASNGGVLAGMAACGAMINIVSTASSLMQDFKTGYLTLASPRSMFVSQIVGTAMGCVISPSVFWLFYKAFDDLGTPNSEYPAPNALVYRNMAILGVEGFSSLPKHCLTLCYKFFAAAILINIVRDISGRKVARFIPLPMAMAIPFYLGANFAIDMCVGSLILFIWEKRNKASADKFAPAVASGLICGEGIWTLPASVLALAGVKAPICMKFLSRRTNSKVDDFLAK